MALRRYVLDELSAGLHPADTEALLVALDQLKRAGNSLLWSTTRSTSSATPIGSSTWARPPACRACASPPPNDGAFLSVAGTKLAVYRDGQGDLTALSPVCPHLGCFVHWNTAEKSWDCPCHGSRFALPAAS